MASGDGGNGGEEWPKDFKKAQGTLNEVLHFAVENTPANEDREPETREPLTEEKKEFLNKVFNDMLRDEVKEMKEHIEVLKRIQDSETEEDQEEKEERLEALLDLCETIDNAQDFLKVGGVSVAMVLCRDPSSEVRWRALDLLAMTVQNNPFNQNAMVEQDALKLFIELLDNDRAYQVRVKALYAISCLVRENELAQDALVKEDGFSSMMRAMQSDIEKLQIKAAFLLSALLWEQPKFNEALHSMGMVQQLISLLLQTEHKLYHEHVMSAILHLVSQHAGCRADSLIPDLNFRGFLEERMKELNGKEEYLEELEYCQKLTALYAAEAQNDNGADR
ncbi:hsp70-binding protein 1-like [Lytechinus pictus]|uniref:hsp70-binding protein 1-like n=1 Tax=Lytechinus pictus TaxID=7653 RepID=UPI0030BA0254